LSEIKKNLDSVREIIRKASERCHGVNKKIRLIGVTKRKPVESIKEAYDCGLVDYGENYVQEFSKKKLELLEKNIHWHFIGKLQRNKVKQVVGEVEFIHSVDKISLASEINKVALKKNLIQKILVEVNLGGESTKEGINPREGQSFLNEIDTFENIKICGLMALPPLTGEKKVKTSCFQLLGRCLIQWRNQLNRNSEFFSELSMGTSHDFELAIEYGATMVRVGTSIFGERNNL